MKNIFSNLKRKKKPFHNERAFFQNSIFLKE